MSTVALSTSAWFAAVVSGIGPNANVAFMRTRLVTQLRNGVVLIASFFLLAVG